MFLVTKNKISEIGMFFRADLKDEREAAFLRQLERVFHNVGAQKDNACSPCVTDFIVGTARSDLENEARTTNRPEKVHEES